MSSLPDSSGIYRIICTPTGKIYVGSAMSLCKRYKGHFGRLSRNQHPNRKLQSAWNKYSPDAFTFDILELVLIPDLLTAREQYWMDRLNPFGERGFNISPTAGSNLGMRRTPEHTEKIRLTLLGKPSPFRGQKRSPEIGKKVSLTKQAKHTPHLSWEHACEQCGEIFFNRKHPRQKFCSLACSKASQKRQIEQTCLICGTVFQRQAAKIGPYCSAGCSYQAKRKDIADAFWIKVDKTFDCWLWTGGKGHGRYGLFTMGKHGRTIQAHRFAYEQAYGPIPSGVYVHHHCDNPSCVRPEHLFIRSRL